MRAPFTEYSAKIQDIYLELKDYQFFHSPFSTKIKDKNFIGRRKVLSRLKMILRNSKTKSGAYLITGFRGMGKTSIVRKAIYELNQESRKEKENYLRRLQDYIWYYEVLLGILFLIIALVVFLKISGWVSLMMGILYFPLFIQTIYYWRCQVPKIKKRWDRYEKIEIFLSQGEVKDLDTLRQITTQLCAKWRSYQVTGPYSFWLDLWEVLKFTIMGLSYIRGIHARNQEGEPNFRSILKRLESLNRRLNADQSTSDEIGVRPVLIPGIRFSPFSLRRRDEVFMPQVKGKEVESELVEILFAIDQLRKTQKSQHGKPNFRQSLRKWAFGVVPYQDIPEFIFVIDELDKIEPNYNYSTDEQKTVQVSLDDSSGMFASEKIRQRQETIAALLANLKSFLNIAMAKFIFIGGREMYDASLADIADRDSFYSSIFHDIIYINSFFKDKVEIRSGITRMTEAYLCSLLLPESYVENAIHINKQAGANGVEMATAPSPFSEDDEAGSGISAKENFSDEEKERLYSLKTYFQYLTDLTQGMEITRGTIPNGGRHGNPGDLGAFEKKRLYKIIFLLQNFIIFLTYRSNGTPKKLTGLVENYIVSDSKQIRQQAEDQAITIIENDGSTSDGKLFLCFKYNSQYEIGLTASLYRPYLIIHSRYLKALGDKLLFSNAFIMDHILKFHPFGFSWRNLELIPEIILINKEPNLRGFIADLIKMLSKTYLSVTITGVNQFKFHNKVAKELEYISKISDLSSAAFNFTLDESLLIKRHYKKKLEDVVKHYEQFTPRQRESRYLYSVGFIQNILGDLHYYDKEFDDALMYYYDAAQSLDDCYSIGHMEKHQVVLLLHNQQKIGQTLEKMRAYDSAFSVYQQQILDTPKFLERVVEKDKKRAPLNFLGIRPYRGLQLINKGYSAWLSLVEKQRFDGITRANLIQNRRAFEKLMHLSDEMEIDGQRFEHDGLLTDRQRHHFLLGDYYQNVGSILYYKNRNFGILFGEKAGENAYGKQPANRKGNGPFAPGTAAYQYYLRALAYFLASVHEDESIAPLNDRDWGRPVFGKALEVLREFDERLPNAYILFHIGNLFSKLGDTALTFIRDEEQCALHKKAFAIFTDAYREDPDKLLSELENWCNTSSTKEEKGSLPQMFDTNSVLYLYSIASLFYLRAGRTYHYAFQYKKLLYVIKDHLLVLGRQLFSEKKQSPREKKNRLKALLNEDFLIKSCCGSGPGQFDYLIDGLEAIAMTIVRTHTQAYEVSNRPQILKYRQIFQHPPGEKPDNYLLYNNLATSHEVREVLTLVREVKLKLRRIPHRLLREGIFFSVTLLSSGLHRLRVPFTDHLTAPHATITNKFVRMLELKYRCERNYFYLAGLMNLEDLFEPWASPEEQEVSLDKKIENCPIERVDELPEKFRNDKYGLVTFLITDSIFCLFDVLKTLDIYGLNYMMNHSYRGNAHYKLANWCQALQNLKRSLSSGSRKELEKRLPKLLGTDATYYLEPNYHNELAVKNYRAATEMHTEGKAYKDRVYDMYFLEDDYNDDLYHFSAASERYRLNTGLIRKKWEMLQKKVKTTSEVYKFRAYEMPEEEDSTNDAV